MSELVAVPFVVMISMFVGSGIFLGAVIGWSINK
jgi:hypothetical protein